MRWRDGIVEERRRGTEMKAGRWAKAESGHVRRILKWIFYETICSHNFQIMNRDTISGQIQWLCVLFWVNMNRLSLSHSLVSISLCRWTNITKLFFCFRVCVCVFVAKKFQTRNNDTCISCSYETAISDPLGELFFVWVSFRTIEKSLFSYFLIKISW